MQKTFFVGNKNEFLWESFWLILLFTNTIKGSYPLGLIHDLRFSWTEVAEKRIPLFYHNASIDVQTR